MLNRLLTDLVKVGGSDLHLQSGQIPKIRLRGIMRNLDKVPLTDDILSGVIDSINLPAHLLGKYRDVLTIDFRHKVPNIGQFRINISKCDGGRKLTARSLTRRISNYKDLGFEEGIFENIVGMRNGLVLITGATNSGKSTTLATIIKDILSKRHINLITLEDPIEYLISDKYSIVTQRELMTDFLNFPQAIRAALRQDPDVIMVGEMRDVETIRAALLCAETGHLVLSTLHTKDVNSTLNRLIMTFESSERPMIESILKDTLRCVISQELIHNDERDTLDLHYEYRFFNGKDDNI